MELLPALLLGIVQGLTEFLPVSSTGHLILAREVLGVQSAEGLAVDAVLHFATALAVLVYFRRELTRLAHAALSFVLRQGIDERDRTLILALIAGTIPAVLLGLLLENLIATTFRDPRFVVVGLVAGSGLFVLAEWYARRQARTTERSPDESPVSLTRGVTIGCFQALALVPGMSRSGSTISGGLLLGLSREEAARFAFLLSIPIILGAGSMKALELGSAGFLLEHAIALSLAFVAAFLSGIGAIFFLLRYLKTHSLMVFVYYRLALAALILLVV